MLYLKMDPSNQIEFKYNIFVYAQHLPNNDANTIKKQNPK